MAPAYLSSCPPAAWGILRPWSLQSRLCFFICLFVFHSQPSLCGFTARNAFLPNIQRSRFCACPGSCPFSGCLPWSTCSEPLLAPRTLPFTPPPPPPRPKVPLPLLPNQNLRSVSLRPLFRLCTVRAGVHALSSSNWNHREEVRVPATSQFPTERGRLRFLVQ